MVSGIAMSRTGRWTILAGPKGFELVDLLGTAIRRHLPVKGEPCFVGRELWVLDGSQLHRLSPDDLEPIGLPIQLRSAVKSIIVGYGEGALDAFITDGVRHRGYQPRRPRPACRSDRSRDRCV